MARLGALLLLLPPATDEPMPGALSNAPAGQVQEEATVGGKATVAPSPKTKEAEVPKAREPARDADSRPAKRDESADASEAAPSTSSADPATALADTKQRLEALKPTTDKPETAHTKRLAAILQDRINLLIALAQATKERTQAEHPAREPDHELSRIKKELERVRATIEQATKDSSALLPDAFRVAPARITSAAMDDMKQAIDSAQNDLSKFTTDLEEARSSSASKSSSPLSKLRSERDQIHQQITAMPARRAEREAAVSAATTAEARELANEQLVNLDWESRLAQEQLRAREAQIAMATRQAALSEPDLQLKEAQRDLARRTLDAMKAQYHVFVKRQQDDLEAAATQYTVQEQRENDPLRRSAARQNAELSKLKARLLEDQHQLQLTPALSLDAQKELADRAESDFENLKKLMKEVRASALVAIRLKNDYRHISLARAEVARTELARAAREMAHWENVLTSVELDRVNDPREEQVALDTLLEQLPPSRRLEARKLAEEHNAQHIALLDQRLKVLEQLAERAQATHKQVLRRLEILDEQYAYIRTHIFWMRDEEPIGATMLADLPKECKRLAHALYRITCECGEAASWRHLTPTCGTLTFLAVVLPWPVHRLRVRLSRWVDTNRHEQEPPPA